MTLHGKGKAFRGGILFQRIFYHLPCRTVYNDGIWDLESRKHYVVVQLLSHVWLFTTPWNAVHQAPLSSSISRVCSNSRPLSWWCYLTISSSAIPFSICFQSFPTCGLFQRVGSFTLSGQSTGASASVFPMTIKGWFPLGLTNLISLQSKGLSRVFSSTTVSKHQFFSAQPSLWLNTHMSTWLLEKPKFWLFGPLLANWCLCFLICYIGLS